LRVHRFETPIHAGDEPKPPRVPTGREKPCSCGRSPWCRGQASRDWASCSATCAACQPSPWRAPVRHDAGGEPIDHADPSTGP
jgi:hypothetical protein